MANIQKRPDGRWRARYRDANGKKHAKHFDRKVDAQRWVDEVTASIVTGQYVNPRAARITFKEYAESWRRAQVHRESSAAHVETMPPSATPRPPRRSTPTPTSGPTPRTRRGRPSTPFSVLLRTPCGLTGPASSRTAGQRTYGGRVDL